MWNQLRARVDALYTYADTRNQRALRLLAGVLRLILDIWRQLVVDQALNTAQALTYTTLLSMVPALAVIFAVFKAFVPSQEVSTKVSGWLLDTLFANSVGEITAVVQGFLDRVNTGTVGAVGFVFLLVAAVSTFTAAEKAFNRIWRVPFTRPLHVRLMAYYAVLTLAPGLIAASFFATSWVKSGLAESFGLALASVVVSWALEALALSLMYKLLPHGRVKWRAAIIGGVGGAIGFELTKFAFNAYVQVVYASSTSSQIYGAFALVPVFLMWVWLVWVMVLFGIELAYVAQHHQQLTAAVLTRRGIVRGAQPGPPTGYLLCRVFGEVARRFQQHGGGVNPVDIARALQVEPDELEPALQRLLTGDWLLRVDAGADGLVVPGRPPDQVSLAGLYALAEESGYRPGELPDSHGTRALERALIEAQQRRREALALTFEALLSAPTADGGHPAEDADDS